MQNSSIVHVLGQPPVLAVEVDATSSSRNIRRQKAFRCSSTLANKLIMGTGGTPTIPLFIGQGANGYPEGPRGTSRASAAVTA